MYVIKPGMKPTRDLWFLTHDDSMREAISRKTIRLAGNIREVEVKEYIPPSAGGDKLTRAAAGAVIGFLVAGPLGTIAGAGAGAAGTKNPDAGSYNIYLKLRSFDLYYMNVSHSKLTDLQKWMTEEPPFVQAAAIPTESAQSTPRRAPRTVQPPVEQSALRISAASRRQMAEEDAADAKKAGSVELKRRIDKLDWLLAEGIISDESYQDARSRAEAQYK